MYNMPVCVCIVTHYLWHEFSVLSDSEFSRGSCTQRVLGTINKRGKRLKLNKTNLFRSWYTLGTTLPSVGFSDLSEAELPLAIAVVRKRLP